MEHKISKLHEGLETELGCHMPHLQIFQRCTKDHIHHKRNRKLKCNLSKVKPSEKRISQRYRLVKSTIPVNFRGDQEMDHAAAELGTGLWGVKHYV